MMSYALVVALVFGAFLVAPTIIAVRVLLDAATTSPMVRHVSESKRTFVLVMVAAAAFYAEYVVWVATTRNMNGGTGKIVLVASLMSGTAGLFVGLGLLALRLMSAHRAFDSDGWCSEWALRTMLRQYFAAGSATQSVMLYDWCDNVRLKWGDNFCRLKPAASTTSERLLAVAYAAYPPAFTAVEIVPKQTGDRVPRAQYKNELG